MTIAKYPYLQAGCGVPPVVQPTVTEEQKQLIVELQCRPVEGPFEDQLSSCSGKVRAADVVLQQVGGDLIQPAGPLLQAVMMLEDFLHFRLHLMNDDVVTLAHPRCLLLSPKHIGTAAIMVQNGSDFNLLYYHMIDSQLHSTMRLISRFLCTTRTQWLPVLTNIPPPNCAQN